MVDRYIRSWVLFEEAIKIWQNNIISPTSHGIFFCVTTIEYMKTCILK